MIYVVLPYSRRYNLRRVCVAAAYILKIDFFRKHCDEQIDLMKQLNTKTLFCESSCIRIAGTLHIFLKLKVGTYLDISVSTL